MGFHFELRGGSKTVSPPPAHQCLKLVKIILKTISLECECKGTHFFIFGKDTFKYQDSLNTILKYSTLTQSNTKRALSETCFVFSKIKG